MQISVPTYVFTLLLLSSGLASAQTGSNTVPAIDIPEGYSWVMVPKITKTVSVPHPDNNVRETVEIPATYKTEVIDGVETQKLKTPAYTAFLPITGPYRTLTKKVVVQPARYELRNKLGQAIDYRDVPEGGPELQPGSGVVRD